MSEGVITLAEMQAKGMTMLEVALSFSVNGAVGYRRAVCWRVPVTSDDQRD